MIRARECESYTAVEEMQEVSSKACIVEEGFLGRKVRVEKCLRRMEDRNWEGRQSCKPRGGSMALFKHHV